MTLSAGWIEADGGTRVYDVEAAQGAVRRFWARMRDRFGKLVYFSWLEVTRAGNVHYHAMVVDPPFNRNWDSKQLIARYWSPGLSDAIVRTSWKPSDWFDRPAAAYVGKYAHKFGHKEYQQDYDQVPSSIRTFECSRLGLTVAELEEHLPRFDVVNTGRDRQVFREWKRADGSVTRRWLTVKDPFSWWIVAELRHECGSGFSTVDHGGGRGAEVGDLPW